jgi:hypothetical protein
MRDTRIVRLLIAVYSIFCRWYPARFRAQFGDAMCDVFAEACRDAQRQSERGELVQLALDTLRDFMWSVIAEHLSEGCRHAREWVGPASKRPVRLAYLMTLGGVPLLALGRILLGPSTGMQHIGVMCGLVVHCVLMHAAAARFAKRTAARHGAARDHHVGGAHCQVTGFALRLTLAAFLVSLVFEPVSVVDGVRALGAAPLFAVLWISIPVALVLGAFATAQPLLRIHVATEPGTP